MAAAKKNAKAPKKPSGQASAGMSKPVKKQAPGQVQEGKVFISEADEYLFAQGTHYDIYKKLGAHPSVENGVKGMFFGVWAPNAESVHVIGTFNGWDENLLTEESFIRRIHLQIIANSGQEMLQKPPICQGLSGQMANGWRREAAKTIIKSLWRFMNAISVPG